MTDTSEWIEHDGGPCPVADDAIVEIRFANGKQAKRESRARFWKTPLDWWQHQGSDGYGVISYRVVKP